MSMLNKFRAGAQKAGIQATAFMKEGGNRVAAGSQNIMQGFTLPGEAEKAAKILASFLGEWICFVGLCVVNSGWRPQPTITTDCRIVYCSRPREPRERIKLDTQGCLA